MLSVCIWSHASSRIFARRLCIKICINQLSRLMNDFKLCNLLKKNKKKKQFFPENFHAFTLIRLNNLGHEPDKDDQSDDSFEAHKIGQIKCGSRLEQCLSSRVYYPLSKEHSILVKLNCTKLFLCFKVTMWLHVSYFNKLKDKKKLESGLSF